MGSVYEAQHEMLGTRVALKLLHPELSHRAGLVERFLQEAKVSAQIRSAHVVQVIDVDRTADGRAFIVMELLEGEPLSAALDRERRFPVSIACDYIVQMLEGLEAAHAFGVIHRDLKPENVFVTFVAKKPVLKLIDFGIAKAKRAEGQKNLTVAGVIMGTAEYMAPEQARSADRVDARADIYAVGVMLYEMISGVRPVVGDDARVVALKVERGEVRPLIQIAPDVPPEIAGLVHRAMAPRPELRFGSATEMRLAVTAIMSGRHSTPQGPDARVATAPLAAVGVSNAAAFAATSLAPAVQMMGLAEAQPSAVRTMQFAGPPIEAFLQAPGAQADEPKVDTVRAPPVGYNAQSAGNYGPPPGNYGPPPGNYGPPPGNYGTQAAGHYGASAGNYGPSPGHGAPPARRKKKSGLVWLVTVPLLLGATVVVVLVAVTGPGDPTPPQHTSTTTSPTPLPPAPDTVPTGAPEAPSLNPLGPVPTGPTGPTHPPTAPTPPRSAPTTPPVPTTADASAPRFPRLVFPDGGGIPMLPSVVVPIPFPFMFPPRPSSSVQ